MFAIATLNWIVLATGSFVTVTVLMSAEFGSSPVESVNVSAAATPASTRATIVTASSFIGS
jgi:hypothetical protein